MKNKKNVSDAVRAANRGRSQSSCGPKTPRGKSYSLFPVTLFPVPVPVQDASK